MATETKDLNYHHQRQYSPYSHWDTFNIEVTETLIVTKTQAYAKSPRRCNQVFNTEWSSWQFWRFPTQSQSLKKCVEKDWVAPKYTPEAYLIGLFIV